MSELSYVPESDAGQNESSATPVTPPQQATPPAALLTRREFRHNNEPPIYDTKKSFAELIGVSVRSIEKMLAEQRLPAIRMTRKLVRIPRQEALDHLRRNYTVNAR